IRLERNSGAKPPAVPSVASRHPAPEPGPAAKTKPDAPPRAPGRVGTRGADSELRVGGEDAGRGPGGARSLQGIRGDQKALRLGQSGDRRLWDSLPDGAATGRSWRAFRASFP